MLILTLPAAITLFVFRDSIVQVVFQYSSFTPESTRLVAEAVAYFAFGLLARAVLEPITRAFYAMLDTRTPLLFATLTIATNILLSWVFASRLGHGGLALSIAITYSLKALALACLLSRRLGGSLGQALLASFLRMLVAGAALAGILYWLAGPLRRLTDPARGRPLWTYAVFALALASVGLIYLAAANCLRIPEAFQLAHAIRRRRGRLGVTSTPSAT